MAIMNRQELKEVVTWEDDHNKEQTYPKACETDVRNARRASIESANNKPKRHKPANNKRNKQAQ